jgi:hypothetical protein
MPALNVPSLNNTPGANWTPQQINYYARSPYWLARGDQKKRAIWETWKPHLGSTKWKPNQGSTRKLVMTEFAPIQRQVAVGNALTTAPTRDITTIKERTTDGSLVSKQFVTPHFYYEPEFADFMSHMADHRDNITKQMVHYEEMFYRTFLLSKAPYVYVCGEGLITAPVGMMSEDLTADASKNKAFFLDKCIAKCTSHMSVAELAKALTVAEEDCGMVPFEGSGKQRNKSEALDDRFLLITSSMTWNQFTDDPWVRENRPLGMDIVTQKYRGDLLGRIRTQIEKWGMRIKANADATDISLPDPEIWQADNNLELLNRCGPNPDYANKGNWHVSFLLGAPSAETLDAGPPPAAFAQGMPNGFGAMDWNGKIVMNKNFLIKTGAAASDVDTNDFGLYLRLQSMLNLGIQSTASYNILPIFHKGRIMTAQSSL